MSQQNTVERVIYLALFLNRSQSQVNTSNILQMASSIGVTLDETQVQMVVSAIESSEEPLESLIQRARTTVATPTAPVPSEEPQEEVEQEEEEEEEESTDLGAGLDALFG